MAVAGTLWCMQIEEGRATMDMFYTVRGVQSIADLPPPAVQLATRRTGRVPALQVLAVEVFLVGGTEGGEHKE